MKRVIPFDKKVAQQEVKDMRKAKLTAQERLQVFVDGFVLVLGGKKMPFNKQKRLPIRLMLKLEGSDYGPLYQVLDETIVGTPAFCTTEAAFKDTGGYAAWLEVRIAKQIAKVAGLDLEVI